ncbi:MAG: iron-containing alcohol dehydrogenase [Clostridia bacterium]|nr:iron-containing alcohol dehydrogenase [Clostridia bacterium]
MEFKFLMPTEIHFGEDVVLKNKEVFRAMGNKALIVTGRSSSKRNGSYDDVKKALSQTGVEYVLFDEVEENPSLETIEKGREIGKRNNVEFVIGIGGGSPMDAAKAIALFIKNPDISKENIFTAGKLESIPVVAVPTTSGTGSEVTQHSIVTTHKDKTKKNLGQRIFPKVAFIDWKYTIDLPYDITVNTAIDAFTHLAEGYLNTNSTYMSDIYAEKGFELFKYCFEKLISKDLDQDFRKKVMMASVLGGIQIAQTGTSLPHGMGYPLTYFKGLPHGPATGVLTIEYLITFKDQTKIKRMLNILGLSHLGELEAIFSRLIDIKIDITPEEINEYANSIYGNKKKLRNHPEEVSLEDIVRIYSKSLLTD